MPGKVACVTVDLEQDYGGRTESPAYDGLALVPELISFAQSISVPLSWFVQGRLFERRPQDLARIVDASGSDVYLHGYSHSDPREVNRIAEIERGINAFRGFMSRGPTGYRAPFGVISSVELQHLDREGFTFDSSMFPTWRPGRFCRLLTLNRPHHVNQSGFLEIPVSVVGRLLPIPLSLSYLKLAGPVFRRSLQTIPLPTVVVIGMHMHDLEPLAAGSSTWSHARNRQSWWWRRLYGPDAPEGWQLLQELTSVLRTRGYSFLGLDQLVKDSGVASR